MITSDSARTAPSHALRLALGPALTVVLTAGLLAGCGGDDDPIPSSAADQTPGKSRPIGETPEPTPTPTPASSSTDGEATAAPSATPAPGGVEVQGNGITFRLPGEPERFTQTGKAGSTSITFDIFRYEAAAEVYTVTRGHYPKVGTLPTLKEALETSAKQAGGKIATSRTFTYKKKPAIEGTIVGVKDKGKEVTIFARYVVVDRVMYGLLFLDRGGSAGPTSAFLTFVNSVEFS